MSSQTVTTEGGRASVTSLPTLPIPQTGDQVLGVHGGKVGLFSATSLGGGKIPDMSGYATTTALTQATEELKKEIQRVAGEIPPAPDLSGLATKDSLENEATAREKADTELEKRVNGLSDKINSLPTVGSTSSGTAPLTHFDIPGVNPTGTFEGIIFRRYDGGAHNNAHIDYPSDWPKFAIPPVIVGTATTISDADWHAGQSGTSSNIEIMATSLTGFDFQHPGGWPGYRLEGITFWVKGVIA